MPRDPGSPVLCLFPSDRYDQILAVMADSALLPASHEAWRQGFDERVADLARHGIAPVVVTLEPEAFEAWCSDEDLPCDAHARLEYAEWLATCQTLLRLDVEPASRRTTAPEAVTLDHEPLLTEAAA